MKQRSHQYNEQMRIKNTKILVQTLHSTHPHSVITPALECVCVCVVRSEMNHYPSHQLQLLPKGSQRPQSVRASAA